MKYDEHGRELPDPTPIEIPVRFRGRPESLTDQIRRMVRNELSEAAARSGHETFAEANDFDVDDEVDVPTRYEILGEEVPIGHDNPVDKPKSHKRPARARGDTGGAAEDASSGYRGNAVSAGGGVNADSGGANRVESGAGDTGTARGSASAGAAASAHGNPVPGRARESETR